MALKESHVAGPASPAVRDITLGQLLEQAARSAPDRLALIAGVLDPAARRQWTYAELYAEAQRTARALRRRFEPGERVAVWAHNLPEWVMMEFGAAMAGVVLVTVNPAFRANEVEYVLKQSRAAGVFVVTAFRGNPMLDTVREVAPRCPELREIIRFRRLGLLHRHRRRSQHRAAGRQADRSGHDPVHVGHHRLSRRARCCTTAASPTTAPTPLCEWGSNPATSSSPRCRCSTPAAASAA